MKYLIPTLLFIIVLASCKKAPDPQPHLEYCNIAILTHPGQIEGQNLNGAMDSVVIHQYNDIYPSIWIWGTTDTLTYFFSNNNSEQHLILSTPHYKNREYNLQDLSLRCKYDRTNNLVQVYNIGFAISTYLKDTIKIHIDIKNKFRKAY